MASSDATSPNRGHSSLQSRGEGTRLTIDRADSSPASNASACGSNTVKRAEFADGNGRARSARVRMLGRYVGECFSELLLNLVFVRFSAVA
ncbi:hypothetical protein [Gemmatimonas sp.]|uniref:hypothetical protein n=1 Tax=Gemmatimonas sp. TaxID=1962908 RepID=UPI00398346DD